MKNNTDAPAATRQAENEATNELRAKLLDKVREADAANEKPFRQKMHFAEIPAATFRDVILAWGSLQVRRENPGESFVIDSMNKTLLNQLYYYVTGNSQCDWELHKGLMFIGNFGCGKTTLALCMARILGGINNKEFAFLSAKDLPAVIKEGPGLQHYARRPLVLDEIGRETERVNDYGTEHKPVEDLLALRYNNQAFTIGTANYNLENLGERYGTYIEERMKTMFNFIVVPGGSRRK